MQKQGKLELTWVGKYEEHEIEPRILVEDPTKSFGDSNNENMLIHGDNLIALKALEQDFAGKIKCIYIDPPYNIDAAGVPYQDNIEHSLWLSLIFERLVLLKTLLREDGYILIHIDDEELAYLKIMCDEIFGRNNFVNTLVIETGEVFGTKAAHIEKSFVKVKDYILVYSKNADKRSPIKPLWTKTSEPYDSHYANYIDENLNKTSIVNYLKNIDWVVEIFEKFSLVLNKDNISTVMKLDEKFRSFMYGDVSNHLYQDQPYSRNLPESIKLKLKSEPIVEFDGLLIYTTSSGSVRYYQPFSDALHITHDYESEYTRSTARGDLWKNYHIDMRNVDDEGCVKFKSSKKPERLIKDIMYSYTEKGDWILDSFLGSGTTVAVAHKMNRKWIGIEMGNHAYTHCKTRIDEVINGEQSGISKSVNWQGGGGYKFYELAPSLLVPNPKIPSIMQINPEYTFEQMCEAICKIEGFKYKPQGRMHGHSSEKRFIHVTKEFVNAEYINSLLATLGEGQSVLIYGTKIQSGLRLSDNVEVKKIPKDLLDKCKFESEVR